MDEAPKSSEVSAASASGGETETVHETNLQLTPEEFPLDRYEPTALIGKGTVGTVYLARDRRLHRKKVAVKVLNAVSDEELVAFQQEARATSRLSHRNIIAVYDFGATVGGVPYMAMEYADGISLDRLIRGQGPIDQDRALKIAVALADALAYAHSCGIFHRDIKTSNILLVHTDSNDPDVRLIDFGVAVVQHSADDHFKVQGRTIVGTPQYMSPDQCFGFTYDERSEVYSLGCVLFEMLTGKTPFQAETALAIIAKHANEPPPTLSAAHGGHVFSNRLETLVARCLAKNREDRYLSMYNLKVDLERVIDREYSITLDGFTVTDQTAKHDRDPIIAGIMVALVCFSLASWLCYMHVEKLLVRNSTTLFPTAQRHVDLQLPSLDEYSSQDQGFIRAYNYGRLVIQANSRVTDDDLKTLSTERDLSELKLYMPVLTGSGFHYLASASLGKLVIKKGTLSDECLKSLCALKDLKNVELVSCTGITHTGMEYLKQLPLESLSVEDCSLTNEDLKTIAEIKTLGILNFAENRRVDAETVELLGSQTALRILTISSQQLDFRDFQALSKIQSLQSLHFQGNAKIEDRELLALKDLPRLNKLTFKETCIAPDTLKELINFPHLIRLEFEGSYFNNDHMEALDGLTINHLVLENTRVADKGLMHILKMPRLQRINIRHCTDISLQTVTMLSKKLKECDIIVL